MERPLFPMTYVSISQRAFTNGSHKNLEAIDINGIDTGIDYGRAPCYVKVLAVLEKSKTGFNNTVLVGTCNSKGQKAAVLCADGIERVLTFAYTHDNYIGDIKVGKVYKQWEVFYHEGTTGKATGNHIHLEIGLGWQYKKYKDSYGNWCLKDLISCDKVFWLNDDHKIVNRGLNGYVFPRMPKNEEVNMVYEFKLIKGSFAGVKYPTRQTSKGKYDTTKYLTVGDQFWVDELVPDGQFWIGRMTNGDHAGRWVELDPRYFEFKKV